MSLEDKIGKFGKWAKRGLEIAVVVAGVACMGETCYLIKFPPPPPIRVTSFDAQRGDKEQSVYISDVKSHFVNTRPEYDPLTYSVLDFDTAPVFLEGTTSDPVIHIKPSDWHGVQVGRVQACDTNDTCASAYLKVIFNTPPVPYIEITRSNELEPLEGQITCSDSDTVDALNIQYGLNFSTLPEARIIYGGTDGIIYSCIDEDPNCLPKEGEEYHTDPLPRNIAGPYEIDACCYDGIEIVCYSDILEGEPMLLDSGTILDGATFRVKDVTAPGTIDDLEAFSSTLDPESIDLRWTSPGDDVIVDGATVEDGGTATSLEIRYKYDSPITAAAGNWDGATVLANVPNVCSAGTTCLLPLDVPSGRLCFAMKTKDEVPNASEVSNSPCADVTGSTPQDFVNYWTSGEGYINQIYLLYPEVVSMINGDTANGILPRDMELAEIMRYATNQPRNEYGEPLPAGNHAAYFRALSDENILNEEFVSTLVGNTLHSCWVWDNYSSDKGIILEKAPDGSMADYYTVLGVSSMDATKSIITNFLIQYVEAHKSQYNYLLIGEGGCNPGWKQPSAKTCSQ